MDDLGLWLRRYAVVYLRADPPLSQADLYSLQGVMRKWAASRGQQVTAIFVEMPGAKPIALKTMLGRLESRGERIVLVPERGYFPDSGPALPMMKRLKELDVQVKALPLVRLRKWKETTSTGEDQ